MSIIMYVIVLITELLRLIAEFLKLRRGRGPKRQVN